MDNKNIESFNEFNEQQPSKSRTFFKHVGIVFLSLFLAVLTVIVINIK